MNGSDAFLLVAGPYGDRTIPLDHNGPWSIGRSEEHQVLLGDESVSRNHALLQRIKPGMFFLIDLGSRNGSWINGVRVGVPQLLRDGDRIRIGEGTLTFRGGSGTEIEARPANTAELGETRTTFAARLMSVMVVDIRDFTRLAQHVDSGVLCEAIGTWFRRGGKVMQKHGSWAQKYIGDAIMSVWLHSAQQPQPAEVLSILQSYLSITSITADLQAQFSLPWPLRIGAGINTGVASVGNAGSTSLTDFTALGETVNAAFRIESATRQIVADLAVGQGTYEGLRLIGMPEHYFRPHSLELKGYDAPLKVWAADLDSAQRFVARAASASASC